MANEQELLSDEEGAVAWISNHIRENPDVHPYLKAKVILAQLKAMGYVKLQDVIDYLLVEIPFKEANKEPITMPRHLFLTSDTLADQLEEILTKEVDNGT